MSQPRDKTGRYAADPAEAKRQAKASAYELLFGHYRREPDAQDPVQKQHDAITQALAHDEATFIAKAFGIAMPAPAEAPAPAPAAPVQPQPKAPRWIPTDEQKHDLFDQGWKAPAPRYSPLPEHEEQALSWAERQFAARGFKVVPTDGSGE